MPQPTRCELRWSLIIAVVLSVGSLYLWTVRASGNRFEWGQPALGGYYNYLARGFLGGHLYVPIEPSPQLLAAPDPWDPAVNEEYKMHDMVFFNRHYYLYFGAAPTVFLFAPWHVITGHDLPENFALFLMCFGAFLLSCRTLTRVLSLAGAMPGPWVHALMLLALGICQSVPYLLNRVWVYEIAIGSGYLALSAAFFLLVEGLSSKRRTPWLAASGFLFAVAVACRPHLLLAGMIALGSLAVYQARSGRSFSREMIAFALLFASGGGAIAAYNYERFGNAFEFGFRYQLSGPGQNRVDVAAHNLVPGLYYLLFCRPDLSPVFPWFRIVLRSPEGLTLPPEYFVEPTVGALWVAPFVAGMLIVLRRRRVAKCGPEARMFLSAAAVSSLAILLFLASTHLVTQRYEVDFLPLGVLVSLAGMSVLLARTRGFTRLTLLLAFCAAIVFSAVLNLSLAISGPYGEMLKNRPAAYVRIARWFSPIERYRPALDLPIALAFQAEVAPQPAGFREPLLCAGGQHHGYMLLLEHLPAGLRLVSQAEDSRVTFDIPATADRPLRFDVRYPNAGGTLAVSLDGRRILSHRVQPLVTAPAQVTLGENRIDREASNGRFTGRILRLN